MSYKNYLYIAIRAAIDAGKVIMDIYQNAFRFFRMGYASAESVCLFLVVLVFSMLQLFLVRNKEAK